MAWFGLILFVWYAPVLFPLVAQWYDDADMGHGFFVPVIAGYIVWQERKELLAVSYQPSWWGLPIVLYGGLQLTIATLGAELFLARTAFVITLIGVVCTLGGTALVRRLAFPLFLLFFMVPIPAVIYYQITFPLQMLASRLAEMSLPVLGVPVIRDGNILTLPGDHRLSVVEACSGIRSLLTLTFLSLVYGYFFEKRKWLRALLFFSTVPIAIVANASRVTATGILTEVNPDLAEGLFHTAEGWLIFMVAGVILVLFHQAMVRASMFVEARWRRA
jgi:exosortase